MRAFTDGLRYGDEIEMRIGVVMGCLGESSGGKKRWQILHKFERLIKEKTNCTG